jgi:hypothetical protein
LPLACSLHVSSSRTARRAMRDALGIVPLASPRRPTRPANPHAGQFLFASENETTGRMRYGDHHPGVIGKADSGPVSCIANCSGGDCRNARAMVPQNMPIKAPPIRAAKTNIIMGLSSAGSCCARRQRDIAADGRCRAVKRFTGTAAARCGGSVLVGGPLTPRHSPHASSRRASDGAVTPIYSFSIR